MEFRLFTQVSGSPVSPVKPHIEIDGVSWCISGPLDFDASPSQIPEYACVSYVWGSDRLPNPFYPQVSMSTHTLPALAASIRFPRTGSRAFWIDAFCIPIERTCKAATLSSMGFIYGHASEIIVVLTYDSFRAFKTIASWDIGGNDDPPAALLDLLNSDMWIRSVWTYQEVVNGPSITFVGEDSSEDPVSGVNFLNRLGHFISEFKKRNGMSSFVFRALYPALDAFEDLLADWMIAAYLSRSAYGVMACLQRRTWIEDANYYYSMIGTITAEPSRRARNPALATLADAFMSVCEDKGDYSFIFCANARDTRPGLVWRPAPDPEILRVVVPWHSFGELQRGERDSHGVLTLKNMLRLTRCESIGEDGKNIITSFVSSGQAEHQRRAENDDTLAQTMYECLVQMGFTGGNNPVVMQQGFFYPQWSIPNSSDIEAEFWASTAIRMVSGSPGLVVVSDSARTPKSYLPGIFVGVVSGDPSGLIIEESASQPVRL